MKRKLLATFLISVGITGAVHALASPARHYLGKVVADPESRVSLVAREHKISVTIGNFELSCEDGSTARYTIGPVDALLRKSGKFHVTKVGYDTHFTSQRFFLVEGKLTSATKSRGYLVLFDQPAEDSGQPECETFGRLPWRASRR